MSERHGLPRPIPSAVFLLWTTCLLAGCGSTASRNAAIPESDDDAHAATDVSVSVVDSSGYEENIARLRGQVVLVDFLATWCLPCVEQLPHTLELGRRLADRGLAIVTVSCDEPSDATGVAEFLRGKDAGRATNLISQFGGSPRTMEEFGIESGAVPFYKLYDRSGRLRQTFGINPAAKTQFKPADIDAAVERLLAE
jgi:thiol-disulfide isomerase/thioredoxin